MSAHSCAPRLSLVGLLLACVALVPDVRAESESSAADARISGTVEIGGRTTSGDMEAAQLRLYRDLDEGAIGAFRFLAEDDAQRFYLRGKGENIGYDDQRYRLEGGRYNRFAIDLFYGELPRVFSTSARTPFVRSDTDTFRLPAGVQSAIAALPDAAAQSQALGALLESAPRTDLEMRWLEGRAGVEYKASERLTLDASYRIQDKKGNRLLGMGFGNPGGTFLQAPGPIDESIHTVRSSAEYVREGWSVGAEYLGSFFDNELDALTVDNPFSAADAAGSPTRGRVSLSPDSSAHHLSLSGAAVLPVGFPARVVGSVGYGINLQDDAFLDFSVNSAFPPDPATGSLTLPQRDLDGEVHIVTANLHATARPIDPLDLGLRYRLYRWDNRTDPIVFDQHVENDTGLVDEPIRSVSNDFMRQDVELDAGYRVSEDWVLHLGYELEAWRRSESRQVRDLAEHGPYAKADWRPGPRSQLRLSYRFRDRVGDDYEPCAHFDATLQGCSELGALRKFDQADRSLHDLRGRYHLMPRENVDLSLSGDFRHVDYDADFGLVEQQSWSLGWDGHVQLHPRIGIGAHYVYEALEYEMDSRWRPRNFAPPIVVVNSPLNDWSSRIDQRFHTGGVTLDLVLLVERVELELGYLVHHGREKTNASGAAGLATPPGGAADGGNAADWPEVEERLQAATVALEIFVTDALTLEARYRFEDFHLDDFRREVSAFEPDSNVSGSGATSPSRDIFLSEALQDYRAHVVALTASVEF